MLLSSYQPVMINPLICQSTEVFHRVEYSFQQMIAFSFYFYFMTLQSGLMLKGQGTDISVETTKFHYSYNEMLSRTGIHRKCQTNPSPKRHKYKIPPSRKYHRKYSAGNYNKTLIPKVTYFILGCLFFEYNLIFWCLVEYVK